MKRHIPAPDLHLFDNVCPFCKSKDISEHGNTIGGNMVYYCDQCLMIFSVDQEHKRWVHSKKANKLPNEAVIIA